MRRSSLPGPSSMITADSAISFFSAMLMAKHRVWAEKDNKGTQIKSQIRVP